MEVIHRGHKIVVNREKCLAGYSLLYYSIFRVSDGYECLSSYEDSAETVRDMVKMMKDRVDNELQEADPWMEKEGLGFFTKGHDYVDRGYANGEQD